MEKANRKFERVSVGKLAVGDTVTLYYDHETDKHTLQTVTSITPDGKGWYRVGWNAEGRDLGYPWRIGASKRFSRLLESSVPGEVSQPLSA